MSPFKVVSPISPESGVFFPKGSDFRATTADGLTGIVISMDNGFLFQTHDAKGNQISVQGHENHGLQLADGLLVIGCLNQ